MLEQRAKEDFHRALNRASWRKILSRLTGANNQLLPYDEVRSRLPVRGQHYIGLHQVPIDKIVGSMGRYKDFDRAFLPTHERTKERWMSIDRAHYADINLPPVELIKLGDIYFVKDGNHRVSVAREQGQLEIDAYVTEVDILVRLDAKLKIDDLTAKEKQIQFLLTTDLHQIRPGADIGLSDPELYSLLLEHISTHRWYLGVEQKREISFGEAVGSWYDLVYLPIIEEIRQQNLLKSFPNNTEADLYIWIVEYEKYLRMAYTSEEAAEDSARSTAAVELIKNYPQSEVGKLVQLINRTNWLDRLILDRDRVRFYEQTHLLDFRPDANIEATLPTIYDRLFDHIATHRWYLGENRQGEVSYTDAVLSWFDTVYQPIVQVIREQEMLKDFPNRTETDLYLWIVRHQWYLKEAYGEDVPIEKAAGEVSEKLAENPPPSIIKRVQESIKNVLRRSK